jgi:hypothetical protein
MFSWIIQISIISIIFIFLIHHLISFFTSTLTVPKIKDLVNSPTQKYQHIFDTISKKSTSYTDIDLLPQDLNLLPQDIDGYDYETQINSDINRNSSRNNNGNGNSNVSQLKNEMKNELKSFLKKQLNTNDSSSTNIVALDSLSGNSFQHASFV